MKQVFKKIRRSGAYIQEKGRVVRTRSSEFIEKRPLLSFFSLFSILFILIVAGNKLRQPKPESAKKPPVKIVQAYHIGSAPRLTLQGQVEKAGVVQITALAGGVVQNIPVQEGSQVGKGQTLIWLSSNYQGGNALSLARQIAEKQNENVNNTYTQQKELIQKQRDLANTTETNFEKIRDITNQSIGDTQAVIDVNNGIISTLNDLITASPSAANSINMQKTQFMSANLQLNNALRSAQYQSNSDNPPTSLSEGQRDIMLKQLDIQEKALDLNREISNLQLQIARVNEAVMYPSAPFGAIVQHVFVRVGQNVAPGTPLFTLSATEDPPLSVYVYTSKEIAERISPLETSLLHVGDTILRLSPSFVSTEAIQGNLYAIMYTLPQENFKDVTDHGYIRVEIPIGYPDSVGSVPYLPLDSIYQTSEKAIVYVIEHDKATARAVRLGQVYGSFVQINSGLQSGDAVILDRNVIEGDEVTSK